MIADGHTNKVICATLGLGLSSFRTHLHRIIDRLNLDRSKDMRVQLTWLVIDARYEADPTAEIPPPTPNDKSEAA